MGAPADAAPVVALDRRTLDLPRGTGVATYGAVLAAALPRAGFRAGFLRASPALPRPLRRALALWPGALPLRRDADGHRGADVFRVAQVHFDLWGRPLVLRGRNLPALMHWTYPLPLRLAGRPNLVTVHDLIPLLHPALTGIAPDRMRRILRAAVGGAELVVTVSEATRREVIEHLGVPAARVVGVLQAVDVGDAAPGPPPAPLRAGGYWLHVGAVERRKNLPRLLAAWRAADTGLPLVLAGPDGWMEGETAAAVAGDPAVVRIPWLPRPALLGLIRDARALLMPSLAEGFGLPVAEAMALGTPAFTSDRGALREVAGGAALLADPEDVSALAAGLRALSGDPALRARLAAAGRVRAACFHPDAYAERLRGVYERVLGGRHGASGGRGAAPDPAGDASLDP